MYFVTRGWSVLYEPYLTDLRQDANRWTTLITVPSSLKTRITSKVLVLKRAGVVGLRKTTVIHSPPSSSCWPVRPSSRHQPTRPHRIVHPLLNKIITQLLSCRLMRTTSSINDPVVNNHPLLRLLGLNRVLAYYQKGAFIDSPLSKLTCSFLYVS